MNNLNKLKAAMDRNNSLVCVGLDSDIEKLPNAVKGEKYPQFVFNKAIIEATYMHVCAYKPNIAFYEARGEVGFAELKMTMDYLRSVHPNMYTICDAKRADIGNTNKGYVSYIFDYLGFDAITLHPYLGREALRPFLERSDKASIILCRTSNPGASELQDLKIEDAALYEYVAQNVVKLWNHNGNCMLVVGGTYPDELRRVREIVGEMTLLVPGIGAQGADVAAVVRAGQDRNGRGLIINSSRAIIFSSSDDNYALIAGQEAEKLKMEINKYRQIR